MREQLLLQHFSPEEHLFVEQMIDLCKKVENSYLYQLTPFLNPRQEKILGSLASHYGLSVYSSSRFLETEYNRMLIAPDYYVLDEGDFEIGILEISYPTKFYRLQHFQILGTLLHQLGIRREYIGDIVTNGEAWFVFVDSRFLQLIQMQISMIGKIPVKWKEVAPSERLVFSNPLHQEGSVLLLSSLRLDKVVAAGFKISRTQATKLIEAAKVKVDYQEVKNPAKTVDIGQMISVRGFGRLAIKEMLGYSKQGKLKIEINIIKK